MSWETEMLDWSAEGADGKAVDPNIVLALLTAESVKDAAKAYWKLDGSVCLNGLVYGPAPAVVKTILAMIPVCAKENRRLSIELLGQIAVGESAASSANAVAESLAEMRQSAWYFLHGLQFGDLDHVWLYVDVIGVLGECFDDFRGRAVAYLSMALTRDLPQDDIELIKNTLAGLAPARM